MWRSLHLVPVLSGPCTASDWRIRKKFVKRNECGDRFQWLSSRILFRSFTSEHSPPEISRQFEDHKRMASGASVDVDQFYRAVLCAFNPQANASEKQSAEQYLSHVKQLPDLWMFCFGCLTQVPGSAADRAAFGHVQFWCLSTLVEYTRAKMQELSQEERVQCRQSLFHFLSNYYEQHAATIAVFVKNKFVELFVEVLLIEFPDAYPKAFEDLIDWSSDGSPTKVDIVLRVLNTVDEKVVAREFSRSSAEQVRNTKFKDAMRAGGSVKRIVDFWYNVLAAYRHSREEIAAACLRCMSLYISWIDIALIASPQMVQILYACILDGGFDSQSDSTGGVNGQLRLRSAACVCLHAMVGKGMGSRERLELWDSLQIQTLITELSSMISSRLRSLKTDESPHPLARPYSELRVDIEGDLLETVGSFSTTSSTNSSADEDREELTEWAVFYIAKLMACILSEAVEMEKALVPMADSAALARMAHSYVVRSRDLCRLLLEYPLLPVSLEAIDALHTYTLYLRSSSATSSSSFQSPTSPVIDARDLDESSSALLETIYSRLQFPEAFDHSGDAALEFEAQFEALRQRLWTLWSNFLEAVPAVSHAFLQGVLAGISQHLTSLPYQAVEAALSLLFRAGERVKDDDMRSLDQILPQCMCTLLRTNPPVSAYPHPIVQSVYFDLCGRFWRLFLLAPDLLSLSLSSIFDSRGLRHPSSAEVRDRAAVALLKLVRHLRRPILQFVDQLIPALEELITAEYLVNQQEREVQGRVYEALGAVFAVDAGALLASEKGERYISILINPVFGQIDEALNNRLYTQDTATNPHIRQRLTHHLTALSHFTKGFKPSTPPPSSSSSTPSLSLSHPLSPLFSALLSRTVRTLAELDDYAPLLQSALFCAHRMVDVLSATEVLPYVEEIVERVSRAKALDDNLRTSLFQLAGQLAGRFHGDAITSLVKIFPHLVGTIEQRVQIGWRDDSYLARLVCVNATEWSDVEKEKMNVHKQYFQFLQMLLNGRCLEVLAHVGLPNVTPTLLVGCLRFPDMPTARICARLLREILTTEREKWQNSGILGAEIWPSFCREVGEKVFGFMGVAHLDRRFRDAQTLMTVKEMCMLQVEMGRLFPVEVRNLLESGAAETLARRFAWGDVEMRRFADAVIGDAADPQKLADVYVELCKGK